jgi:N6-adenosine-specific RNA methylase IME4
MFKDFPKGKFGTIVADPAWSFNDKGSRLSPDWKKKHKYKTIPAHLLPQLPVKEIAREKAHLYLWTTDTHIREALKLMRMWGFEFKQFLVWEKYTKHGKRHFGSGHYYRHDMELVLFGTRGGAKVKNHSTRASFKGVVRGHSQKPEELQDLVEKMSHGPRVELFARRHREGWTCWGNQLPKKRVKKVVNERERKAA